MLLTIIVLLPALAALVVIAAYYGHKYLNGPAALAQPFAVENVASIRLPWVKVLLIATPFYLAAMYWASMAYDPGFSVKDIAGRPQVRREILRRPFLPLLDSKIAAVAPDHLFRDVADQADGPIQSNILLYEDGKLLGPAHTPLYEVAVVGRGRYAHWKGNYSIFAFSSSDNTDPNTNGRVYSAGRPSEN